MTLRTYLPERPSRPLSSKDRNRTQYPGRPNRSARPDRRKRVSERITTGIDGIIAEHGLPWHVTTAGAKGCITFLPEPTRNLRDFHQVDGRFGEAHWLVQHNGGVFLPPWGKIEQWLISVQHTDEDIDRFVANVRTLTDDLVAGDATQ